MNDSMLDLDHGPKSFQSPDVLDHRSGSDTTATGQGYLGVTEASQQWANAEKARPKAVDQFVGRFCAGEHSGIESDPIGLTLHTHAKRREDLAHPVDIRQIRDVAQLQGVSGQEAGRHQDKG